MRKRQRFTFSLPAELIQELETRRGEDVPMSRVVERMLRKGLENAVKA